MTIYKNRYWATKSKSDKNDRVVKVCGGYTIMSPFEYNVWKNQK